jgi:hypothetical protein
MDYYSDLHGHLTIVTQYHAHYFTLFTLVCELCPLPSLVIAPYTDGLSDYLIH